MSARAQISACAAGGAPTGPRAGCRETDTGGDRTAVYHQLRGAVGRCAVGKTPGKTVTAIGRHADLPFNTQAGRIIGIGETAAGESAVIIIDRALHAAEAGGIFLKGDSGR